MIRSFFVRASPEARQKALRRMLTQNPKVRIRLTEGQKRALAQRSAAANQASRLADLLGTLGDPTRLRILTALGGAGVPVAAIVEATGVRQPTLSHHLRILRNHGLVAEDERDGDIYYCLVAEGLYDALDVLQRLAGQKDDG